MIEFTIPMRAVPKGRPRVTKRGFTYTPKKTKEAEKRISLFAKAHMAAMPVQVGCIEGAVVMQIEFIFTPPKGWSKKKKESAYNGWTFPTVRPDLDNLNKLVLDALNGICYKDDSQIVKLKTSKRYGIKDEINIWILPV